MTGNNEEWWKANPSEIGNKNEAEVKDDKDWWKANLSELGKKNDDGVKPKKNSSSIKETWMSHLRELNKRLRSIWEDGGKKYEDAKNDDELCEKFKEAVSLRKSQIKSIFDAIQLTKNVDLCFVIDATGSMQPYIDGTRKSIDNIVNKLVGGTVERLRLAMVIYRDYEDENRFEILDFIESVDEFSQFCGKIVSDGGDDGPEDVLGGLNEALKLSWDKDQSATKLVFHMCDYPCHGNQFHDLMRENHPDGDIHGLTHNGIFDQLRSKDIQYSFGKITKHTDIMLKKFAEAYKDKILTFDVKDADLICNSVVRSVEKSVLKSSTRATSITTGKDGEPLKERDFVFTAAEPDWKKLESLEGVYITYKSPKSINDIVEDVPLKHNKPSPVKIKVAPHPFSRGVERVAFYGRDIKVGVLAYFSLDKDKDVVLKEYLHEHSGDLASLFETSNQVQTIAAFLAKRFCEKIRRKINVSASIKFLETKTLAIENADGKYRYMTCEDRLHSETKFIRFSNNVDYEIMEEQAKECGISMEYVNLLMTFSHWTHKITEGMLMVVDLQGIVTKIDDEYNMILTDPAINCVDVTRFGSTNLGERGMQAFLRRHKCNKFCEALGLDK